MLPLNSEPSARDRFEQFYSHHQAWVLVRVIRLTRDRDLAADISQSVWTKILSRWEIYEPRIAGTGVAWLTAIVINAVRDYFRGVGRRPEVPIDPELLDGFGARPAGCCDAFEQASEQERRRILDTFVARLSSEDQALIHLIVERGLSTQEAAEALESTAPAVIARWFRIKARLRTLARENGLG